MKYEKILVGEFLSRPNRFIAMVCLGGEEVVVHVKNTGRCRELLTPGAKVYLEEASNPNRKTKYDLVAVVKGDLLVNMDAQAPNKIFREWAESGGFSRDLTHLQGEKTFGQSRFDFYYEYLKDGILQKGFVEVKGVTLEEDGVARFPDAPTQRGVKHIRELMCAKSEGYEAHVCFVVQMAGMTCMKPNDVTHPEFGNALREAKAVGVEVFALSCEVGEDSLVATGTVAVEL